jgi:hypothetical protein
MNSNLVYDVTHSFLQNGYKIILKKLEAIDKNNILKITSPSIELLSDCQALLKGTAELTKEFSSCSVCLYMRNAHCATQLYLSETSPSFTHSISTVLSENRCALKKGFLK